MDQNYQILIVTIQVLITVGSLGAMMWSMLKFLLRDIHKDLTDLKEGMKRSETRTDHLYEICIGLLKNKKK